MADRIKKRRSRIAGIEIIDPRPFPDDHGFALGTVRPGDPFISCCDEQVSRP